MVTIAYFSNSSWYKKGRYIITIDFQFGSSTIYAIKRFQENRIGLELNETNQPFVYADNVKMLEENLQTVRENAEIFITKQGYWFRSKFRKG